MGKSGSERGRSEDAGPLLQSDGGRWLSDEQFRSERWASSSEREPAMFAARSCGGVIRCDIGETGIGWATRAARRWGLMVLVSGRRGLVLCPCCVSGAARNGHLQGEEKGDADMLVAYGVV
jgi:hypothetical protein